nr:MAG: hypothetical protein MPKEOOLM_00006 [Merbecovirus sp. PaGB01]
MAFSPSIFKPIELISAFDTESAPNVVLTCVPTVGYTVALAVNACLVPLLLCLKQDTCRGSILKTLVLYGLMFYNFVLSVILVNGTSVPLGGCLLAFVILLSLLWFADRIRFCFMLKSCLPLIDMRSNFVRVNTTTSQVVVAVNQAKPCFIKNFDQHCRCSRCFYVHSATYLECTFISRFQKQILVSVTDFSLGGNLSTVFVPATRDTVPLHIIAPSVV